MRIAIFIKDLEKLSNWELRLIKEIKKNESLELALLLKDDKANNELKTETKSKVFNTLFEVQSKLEAKFFPRYFSLDKAALMDYVYSIDLLSVDLENKDNKKVFKEKDKDKIKAYKLDFILQEEYQPLENLNLKLATYGIFGFKYGAEKGLKNLLKPKEVIELSLVNAEDKNLCIGRGFYNTHWSYYRNSTHLREQSVVLFLKTILKIEREKELSFEDKTLFKQENSLPKVLNLMDYLLRFYTEFIGEKFRKVFKYFLGAKYGRWTLFIGEGSFIDADLKKLKPVELPKKEFWADPFLYEHKGETYVFFENYPYTTHVGKLSYGKLVNGEIKEVEDLDLGLSVHLSYPSIFEEDGDIYMIPETHQSQCVQVYKCVSFPDKWELYSKGFEGKSIVDTTYYKDEKGDRWLFLNEGFRGHCCNLYIYKIDSLKLNKIESHLENPVAIDSRIARNGGAIFKDKGRVIRPSQNNSKGIYGYALNLNEIKELNLSVYKEEVIKSIKPDFYKGLEGTHHLHQYKGGFVLDASYKKTY